MQVWFSGDVVNVPPCRALKLILPYGQGAMIFGSPPAKPGAASWAAIITIGRKKMGLEQATAVGWTALAGLRSG
jgi:hypothetical protein